MAGRIILDCPNPALDSNGDVDSAATLTFYENGTTTLQSIYSGTDLATPLANPLSPDAAGRFADVWAADGTGYSVKWIRGDGTIKTFDDIYPFGGGGSSDITPESRGALADGSTDDSIAIYNAAIAAQAAGVSVIFASGKQYRIDSGHDLKFENLENISLKSSGPQYATILIGPNAGAASGNRAVIFRYADGLRIDGIWFKGDNSIAAQNLLCIENTSDVRAENFKCSDQTGQSVGLTISNDTARTDTFTPATLTTVFALVKSVPYASGNTIVAKADQGPRAFAASDVDTATSKIAIAGHSWVGGELVAYAQSDASPGPSTVTPPGTATGGLPWYYAASTLIHSYYYAVKWEDKDTIRLCLTKQDALVDQTSCASTAVDTSADTFTVNNHGYTDGNSVAITSSGSVPSGTTANKRYWVKYIDANTFKLLTDSRVGTVVDLASQGSGTHTFTPWIVFNSAGTTGTATNQLTGAGVMLTEGTHFSASGDVLTMIGQLAGGIGGPSATPIALQVSYAEPCDDIVIRNGEFENMGYQGFNPYPKLASKNWLVENLRFKDCGTANVAVGAMKSPQLVQGQVRNIRIEGGYNGFDLGNYNDIQISGVQVCNVSGNALALTVQDLPSISTPTFSSFVIDDVQIWNDPDFTPLATAASIFINGAATNNGPIKFSNFSISNTPWWMQIACQQAIPNISLENFDCIGLTTPGTTAARTISCTSTVGALPLGLKMRNFFLKQNGTLGTSSVLIVSPGAVIENGRFDGIGAGNPGTGALIVSGDKIEASLLRFDRCNPSASAPAIQVADTNASHTFNIVDCTFRNLNSGLVSTIYSTSGGTVTAYIGSTLPAGTSGGVPYFNSATSLASSAALATNGVVLGGGGAGAAPSASAQFSFNPSSAFLTIKGASSNPPAALSGQVAEYSAPDSATEAFYFWRAIGSNPAHVFERANGTTGSLTNVVSGNIIGRLYFGGYDGSAWQVGAGQIRFVADGDWSGTARGSALEVFGTVNGATTTQRVIYASTNFLAASSTNTFGGLYNGASSATQPSILVRTADTTTGYGSSGSGIIDGIVSGATATILTSTGLEVKKSLRASAVTALGTTGTVSLDPTLGNVFSCTPSGNITALNAASVPAGQVIDIVFTTSGTSSFTVTFGTGFKTTGTLSTGTVSGKVFAMQFVSDGTNFNEVSRTVAM